VVLIRSPKLTASLPLPRTTFVPIGIKIVSFVFLLFTKEEVSEAERDRSRGQNITPLLQHRLRRHDDDDNDDDDDNNNNNNNNN